MPRGFKTAALVALLAIQPLGATEPQVWRLDSFADYKAGELEDVSLGSDGALALAPRREILQKWPSAHVWSLARDRQGTLYAGTGNDGRLFALKPGAEASLLFDAEEPIVQAVLIDKSGRVLAGTSPGGKVYRVEPSGKAEVFFDPPERYIWALASTPQGDLWVATGDPAVLYRVDSAGRAQPLLKSEELHFRSLAVGPAGDIYVGTAENAYVYRVTPKGEAYVLYDAGGSEVSALTVDGRGVVYAAAVGGGAAPAAESQPSSSAPESPAPDADVTVTVTVSASADEETQAAPQTRAREASKPARGGGRNTEIYRIRPDGYPEVLWRSATDMVYSLAVDANGDLIAGTGEPATLLRITPQGKASEWARLEGAQVTQILRTAEGEWFAGTSNLGSVARMGPARAVQGTFTSPVKDAEIFSDWGELHWESEVPRGSGLELEVRSGNTQKPGDTWSPWTPVRAESSEGKIASPAARFLQWRARLRSERGGASPVLRVVEAYYRQRNVAPEIAAVRLEDPGVVIERVQVPGAPQGAQAGAGRRSPGATAQRRPPVATRRSFERGRQTVSWTARDRNQDTLKYDLYYRRLEESRWRPLKTGLDDDLYAFDTTSLPDGRYLLRVVASDQPANPRGEALNGEAESDPFTVDNTPPRVESVQASVRGKTIELSFEVVDTFSPVRNAEYALDGGDWTALDPQDGVADSLRERYRAEVGADSVGEHTFGVRAVDQMGNRGAGYVSVEIR